MGYFIPLRLCEYLNIEKGLRNCSQSTKFKPWMLLRVLILKLSAHIHLHVIEVLKSTFFVSVSSPKALNSTFPRLVYYSYIPNMDAINLKLELSL